MPFLLFDGNCAEAMTFYHECIEGELTITKLKDSPMKNTLSPEKWERVINAHLKSDNIEISATDWMAAPEYTPKYGDVFAIFVLGEAYDELKEAFDKLSVGHKEDRFMDLHQLPVGTHGQFFGILEEMKFALATNSEYPDMVGGDKLLLDAFKRQGDSAIPVVWNNPSIVWEDFDAVIIRSCWGYYHEVEAFERWIATLQQQQVPLLNTPDQVRWNIHKNYLLDLGSKGAPIPDTLVVKQNDKRTLQEILNDIRKDTVVIKPCYGASAFGVMKVTKDNASETKYKSLLSTGDVLVQSFIPEIHDGEYSAIFINSTLSHTVLKRPKPGDFRSNHEWGGTEELAKLGAPIISEITRMLRQCISDTLYARLDFVITPRGLVLMELELIEPYLFFEFDTHAPAKFAEASKNALA